MNIIEEKQNVLLNRRELKLDVSDLESPPKMDVARKMISEKFSMPEEQIHISKIAGKFGTKGFTIIANIYNTTSEKDRFHLSHKKEKAPAK